MGQGFAKLLEKALGAFPSAFWIDRKTLLPILSRNLPAKCRERPKMCAIAGYHTGVGILYKLCRFECHDAFEMLLILSEVGVASIQENFKAAVLEGYGRHSKPLSFKRDARFQEVHINIQLRACTSVRQRYRETVNGESVTLIRMLRQKVQTERVNLAHSAPTTDAHCGCWWVPSLAERASPTFLVLWFLRRAARWACHS